MHPFSGFYSEFHVMLMTVYTLLNHFITARGKVYICMLIHIYVYKMNNWQRLAIFDVLNELMC